MCVCCGNSGFVLLVTKSRLNMVVVDGMMTLVRLGWVVSLSLSLFFVIFFFSYGYAELLIVSMIFLIFNFPIFGI